MLKIEHFAYQVASPTAVADWYCEQLGFTIKRAGTDPAATHFLADASGNVMIEIYCNSAIDVPDYAEMHHLTLHLAFACNDIEATMVELEAAGATVAVPISETPSGDKLVMLRDPWGMAIQLCKRANPMI